MKITKQEYTAEFMELAVKLVKDGQGIPLAALIVLMFVVEAAIQRARRCDDSKLLDNGHLAEPASAAAQNEDLKQTIGQQTKWTGHLVCNCQQAGFSLLLP